MNNTPLTLSQDRQARNKPPPNPAFSSASGSSTTHPNASSSSSSFSSAKGKGKAYPTTTTATAQHPGPKKKTTDEQFEERERRDQAARILGSREMLIWHAMANNEVRFFFLFSLFFLLVRFLFRCGVGCRSRVRGGEDSLGFG